MEVGDVGREAVLELLELAKRVPDPRRETLNKLHPVVNIVVLSFCAKLAGAESFAEMHDYAKAKEAFFAPLLDLANGIPAKDTFWRVLSMLDPDATRACLQEWLEPLRLRLRSGGKVQVAIDGKSMRGGADADGRMLHVVGAFDTDAGMALGQVAVEEKSNEIAAIPKLIDKLDLEGTVVTIDAAGCQKEIAAKIVAKQGDYVLALKDNHPKLHDAVAEAFLDELEKPKERSRLRSVTTREEGHGRRTETTVQVMPASKGLPGFAGWAKLRSVVVVCRSSLETRTGKVSDDVRHYLTTLPPRAGALAGYVRGHWGIENGLHWILDVVFKEDASRVVARKAANNLSMLNRMAASLLRNNGDDRTSMKRKVKKIAMDDNYLLQTLSAVMPT